jgi:glycosyltransferase involved in cell wall biosynthesis
MGRIIKRVRKTKDIATKEKKICLCMIVKNESKIIERCLNSAKPILDFVSICDTGSNDGTPEIINNWCKENNIPGTVHFAAFKNFGFNRTLAISMAQESYHEADYILLLDADMILEVEHPFNKYELDKDQYLTPQYLGQIKFWLTRLLKASLPWKSVGVTHEYWDIDRSKLNEVAHSRYDTKGKLDNLVIIDQQDGGSRTDKFERDKRLLLEGIQDPLTSPDLKIRYMFYLGQTYLCLNEYEESIYWYKKRVEAGSWAEEVFYSLLNIGLLYEILSHQASDRRNNLLNETNRNSEVADPTMIETLILEEEQFFGLATTYLQNAWEYRTCRAEPLYHLAKMYRLKSKHNIGLMYALQGSEIPFPKDDILFVDYHVYDYLFDFEISICANYISSKLDIGRAAQKRLESKIEQLPPNIANAVKRNSNFW